MPNISIIVPVFNSEKFVSTTLDSLIAQTYSDLEIICVNDGSTDASLSILEKYADADKRISVITQDNQGVSTARNTGIHAANGDILMFVDADDMLVPSACERVVELIHEQSPEMITFGLMCDPPEAAPATLRRELTPPSKTYNGFETSLLFGDYSRPYACRSAILKEFATREHVLFEPDISLGEDQVFYFATYPFSRKTVLVPDQLYIYRMNNLSATHIPTNGRENMLKKLHQHLLVIEAISRIWTTRNMHEFCSEEFLEWCLAFLMLDVSKLPAQDQAAIYKRLVASLSSLYCRDLEPIARRIPTRRCLLHIQRAVASTETITTPVIPSVDVVRFYLMYRGFSQCAERILMRLGIVK